MQRKPHTQRNTDTALSRIVYHCEGLSGVAVHSRSDRLLPCMSSHATLLRQLSRAENNSKAARQGVVKQAATESIWQQVPTYFYFSRQASISRSTRLATSTPLNTERGWGEVSTYVLWWRCTRTSSPHQVDAVALETVCTSETTATTKAARGVDAGQRVTSVTYRRQQWRPLDGTGHPVYLQAVVIQVDNSRA